MKMGREEGVSSWGIVGGGGEWERSGRRGNTENGVYDVVG